MSSSPFDWSFVDAVYLITCPNCDPNSERLNTATKIIEDVNLLDKLQVKGFDTDDEDRIRGCYASHISVLKDALSDLEDNNNGNANGQKKQGNNFLEQLSASLFNNKEETTTDNESNASALDSKQILVLEDNLASNGKLQQSTINSVSQYISSETWDMIHLSYIPYVPNLTVSRTPDYNDIVKLSCGVGSALGTTAYIINGKAMKAVLKEHEKMGFYAPIPDVMAKLFPETRYAAYPTPFLRAPLTKSLVNPQLDDLRSLLFQTGVVSQVQNILTISGLSTNALLPIAIVTLLIGTCFSGKITLDAAYALSTTGNIDGPIIIPLLSSLLSIFFLLILAQGIMLAPKPAPELEDVAVVSE